MEINSNTWYYTLSTIAQTLAAILALAAVFIVLRLQGILKNINDYKERAHYIFDVVKRHQPSYDVVSSDREVLCELQKLSKNWKTFGALNSGISTDIANLVIFYEQYRTPNAQEFINDTRRNLDSFIEQKYKLINLIKVPALFTSITITTAIFFLTFTNELKYQNCLLGAAFIFVFLSIFLTLRAAWLILLAIE